MPASRNSLSPVSALLWILGLQSPIQVVVEIELWTCPPTPCSCTTGLPAAAAPHPSVGDRPGVLPLALAQTWSPRTAAPDANSNELLDIRDVGGGQRLRRVAVARHGSRSPQTTAPIADWTTLPTTASALGTCASRWGCVQLSAALGAQRGLPRRAGTTLVANANEPTCTIHSP